MQRIGPYQVEAELGRGGMGVVYRVRDEQDRVLALKLILPGVANADAIARFAREAEVMGRVNHPNVVRIHTLGRAAEGPFMVSELIEGDELKDRLRRGPLPGQQVAAILRDLADAVAACHRAGVLHRDIKPGNVMLRRHDGSPVLLDFGIAQDESAEKLTQTGALLGTLNYMSPEQASGEKVDGQTDVYALGGVLYSCISGQPPFAGKSSMALVKAVISDPLRPPSSLREDIDPALEAICSKAMAKEKHARYGSPEELREDLDRYLAGKRPTALGEAEARSTHKALIATAGVVLLLLLGGLGLALAWPSGDPQVSEEDERKTREIAERKARRAARKRMSDAKRGLAELRSLRLKDPERFLEKAPAWWREAADLDGLRDDREDLREDYLRVGLEHPVELGPPLPSGHPGGGFSPVRFRFLAGSKGSRGFVWSTHPASPGLILYDMSKGTQLRTCELKRRSIRNVAPFYGGGYLCDSLPDTPFVPGAKPTDPRAENPPPVYQRARMFLTRVNEDLEGAQVFPLPDREEFEAEWVLPDNPEKSGYWDPADPTTLSVSPSGRVAVGFDNGLLVVYEFGPDGVEQRGVLQFGQRVQAAAFLPDERLVVGTGSMDETLERASETPDVAVRFFSADLQEEKDHYLRLSLEPLWIEVSPSGALIAVGTASSRQVLLFHGSGELRARLSGEGARPTGGAQASRVEGDGNPAVAAMAGSPLAAAFSPNEDRIYVVGGDTNTANRGLTELRAWRIRDGKRLAFYSDEDLEKPEREIFFDAALAPRGDVLITTTVKPSERGKPPMARLEAWRVDLPH